MDNQPIRFLPREVGLVREYRQVIGRRAAVEVSTEPMEDVSLNDPLPDRYRVPSGEECLALWRNRWPTLASTAPLVVRIEELRGELLRAVEALPEPPKGRVAREVVEAQADAVKTVRRAISMFARLTYAIESVRSMITFWAGEIDEAPVEPRAIGASVIYHPAYRKYDRWRVRVTRLSTKVVEANRKYDATRNKTKERREYKRHYIRTYRQRQTERGGGS